MRYVEIIEAKRMPPGQDITQSPPKGVLASYTDQDGYTVSIVGLSDDPNEYGRCGEIYISDGKTTLKAGYWMNYPNQSGTFRNGDGNACL